jgi:hypothetical protein
LAFGKVPFLVLTSPEFCTILCTATKTAAALRLAGLPPPWPLLLFRLRPFADPPEPIFDASELTRRLFGPAVPPKENIRTNVSDLQQVGGV